MLADMMAVSVWWPAGNDPQRRGQRRNHRQPYDPASFRPIRHPLSNQPIVLPVVTEVELLLGRAARRKPSAQATETVRRHDPRRPGPTLPVPGVNYAVAH